MRQSWKCEWGLVVDEHEGSLLACCAVGHPLLMRFFFSPSSSSSSSSSSLQAAFRLQGCLGSCVAWCLGLFRFVVRLVVSVLRFWTIITWSRNWNLRLMCPAFFDHASPTTRNRNQNQFGDSFSPPWSIYLNTQHSATESVSPVCTEESQTCLGEASGRLRETSCCNTRKLTVSSVQQCQVPDHAVS